MPTNSGRNERRWASEAVTSRSINWLAPHREKPGRKHSLREKDLLGLTQAEEAGTYSQQPARPQEQDEVQTIALEAPRHLVWLLLRAYPKTCDTMTTKIKEVKIHGTDLSLESQ